jgi:hypothetical protein
MTPIEFPTEYCMFANVVRGKCVANCHYNMEEDGEDCLGNTMEPLNTNPKDSARGTNI